MKKVLTIIFLLHFSLIYKVYGDVNRGLIYTYLHRNPVFELSDKWSYLKIILHTITKNLKPAFSEKIFMARTDNYALQG